MRTSTEHRAIIRLTCIFEYPEADSPPTWHMIDTYKTVYQAYDYTEKAIRFFQENAELLASEDCLNRYPGLARQMEQYADLPKDKHGRYPKWIQDIMVHRINDTVKF